MSGRRVVRLPGTLLGTLAVAILVAALLLWRAWHRPAPLPPGVAPDSSVVVTFPPGIPFRAAVDTLVARGLVRQPRLLLLAARRRGVDRRWHAGDYRFRYGLSPAEVLDLLAAGRTELVTVTLPEGESARVLARRIGEALGVSPERVLAVADSLVRPMLVSEGGLAPAAMARYDSLRRGQEHRFGRPFPLCEGYLHPDTYRVDRGAPVSRLVAAILAEGRRRRAALLARHPLPDGWTWHRVLTLASIVEAETPRDDEKPLVAAVYRERLRRGWKLEADPTVAYVLDKKGRRILYKDLAVDSPWNTYCHAGLPPGPIGNPGDAAVAAVLAPDPECHALYFVADGEGGHVFSRTLAEHRRAVARYRRLRQRRLDGKPRQP